MRQDLHDEPAPPSLYLRVVSTSVSFAKRETQKLSEGQPRLRILSGVPVCISAILRLSMTIELPMFGIIQAGHRVSQIRIVSHVNGKLDQESQSPVDPTPLRRASSSSDRSISIISGHSSDSLCLSLEEVTSSDSSESA